MQQARSSNKYADSNQQKVVLGITDRQQAYFDSTPSHQVTLQDLRGHGDPVSMQTLQQHHQQQQQRQQTSAQAQPLQYQQQHATPVWNIGGDISATSSISDYFSGRVPPPAHHNISQQQQNGTSSSYFDLERWNLPAANSKMFTGQGGALGSQSSLSHGSNFVGNSAHQQQSLMMPLSYFPPFHLPTTTQHATTPEYQNLTPAPVETYATTTSSSNNNYVPSIEVKHERSSSSRSSYAPSVEVKQERSSSSRSNYAPSIEVKHERSSSSSKYAPTMETQQERSSSSRSNYAPSIEVKHERTTSSNNTYAPTMEPQQERTSSSRINYAPSIEPQRDRNSSKYVPNLEIQQHERASIISNYIPNIEVQPKVIVPNIEEEFNYLSKSVPVAPQAAFNYAANKEAPKTALTTLGVPATKNDFYACYLQFLQGERESSPPGVRPSGGSAGPRKPYWSRTRTTNNVTPQNNEATTSATLPQPKPEPKYDPQDDPRYFPLPKSSADRRRHMDSSSDSDSDLDLKKSKPSNPTPAQPALTAKVDSKPRKSFDKFLKEKFERQRQEMYKKKKEEEKPPPRREMSKRKAKENLKLNVDGGNQEGDEYYEEDDSDSDPAWTPQATKDGPEDDLSIKKIKGGKHRFTSLLSTTASSNMQRQEGPDKMLTPIKPADSPPSNSNSSTSGNSSEKARLKHSDILELYAKESLKYQDNFEVYIQTLISRALDTNFLTEIFQEKDEYFLSNVRTIDSLTESKKNLLIQASKWQNALIAESISTWPHYNVIADLTSLEKLNKYCAGCAKPTVDARLILYGQPYNNTTLDGCTPHPRVANIKDMLMCLKCIEHVELMSKVAHQKYLMFVECANCVNERRNNDETKDSTVILNELLADEVWLNKLFTHVRYVWAQIDNIAFNST